jgi:hypothetical protein
MLHQFVYVCYMLPCFPWWYLPISRHPEPKAIDSSNVGRKSTCPPVVQVLVRARHAWHTWDWWRWVKTQPRSVAYSFFHWWLNGCSWLLLPLNIIIIDVIPSHLSIKKKTSIFGSNFFKRSPEVIKQNNTGKIKPSTMMKEVGKMCG